MPSLLIAFSLLVACSVVVCVSRRVNLYCAFMLTCDALSFTKLLRSCSLFVALPYLPADLPADSALEAMADSLTCFPSS